MKKIIRITEGQLKQIIENEIKQLDEQKEFQWKGTFTQGINEIQEIIDYLIFIRKIRPEKIKYELSKHVDDVSLYQHGPESKQYQQYLNRGGEKYSPYDKLPSWYK